MPFDFRYRLSGDPHPTVRKVVMGTATLNKGDVVNLAGGQAVLAATGNTNLRGVVQETKTGVVGTDTIAVLVDSDAVYAVVDANARAEGATLDLAGATGAQTVAASVNKEFVVVAPSTAQQETLVRFNVGKHVDNKAQ